MTARLSGSRLPPCLGRNAYVCAHCRTAYLRARLWLLRFAKLHAWNTCAATSASIFVLRVCFVPARRIGIRVSDVVSAYACGGCAVRPKVRSPNQFGLPKNPSLLLTFPLE